MNPPQQQPDAALDRARKRLTNVVAKRNASGWWCLLLTFVILFVGIYVTSAALADNAVAIAGAMLASPLLGFAPFVLGDLADQRAVRLLVDCPQPRNAGPLLSALPITRLRRRSQVSATIRRLATQLTRDSVGEFTAEQRFQLNMLLFTGSCEELIALLAVFERIGDSSALPYIAGLAAGHGIPRPLRSDTAVIKAAAQRTACAIQATVEAARASQTLLRAGQHEVSAHAMLMRAAGSSQAGPDGLLRSASQNRSKEAADQ